MRAGSITDPVDVDALMRGVDFVAVMLGDREVQRHTRINTAFLRRMVPATRRQGVHRLFYQAGAPSRPPTAISPSLWMLRHTLARGYIGQHEDNETAIAYLETEACDVDWIVHRAGIGSDGSSRAVLHRSDTKFSVATFRDCAAYDYAALKDAAAAHAWSLTCCHNTW